MPTNEPSAWMWAEAFDMLERAERLHRQFFRRGRGHGRRPTWEPPVDVFETDSTVWIQVALVGVPPELVEVTIDGGLLIVKGERRLLDEARQAAVHRLEIPYGCFERRIPLPPGRFEVGRRDLQHGCLTLSLRKVS